MAKKPKNGKQEEEEVKQEELTEWQKLHQMYLEKKEQEAAMEREKQEEKKKALLDMQKTIENPTVELDVLDKEEEDMEEEGETTPELSLTQEDKKHLEREEKLNQVAERRHRKEAKRAEKQAKKEAKKEANKNKIPYVEKKHVYRAIPVFLISFVLFLLSIYFLTPYATLKNLTVSGNKEVNKNDILNNSGIDSRDYTVTTFLNRSAYAKNIKNSNPWLESVEIRYQFPVSFIVDVKEYKAIAYNLINEQYYPVLETGAEIGQAVTAESIPEGTMTLKLADQDILKKFVKEIAGVDDSIKSNIQLVSLTPSKASKDLLTLTMYDGNQILIPLTDLQKKLPYYEGIRKQLSQASLIDMEAGVFSSPLS